MTEQPPFPFDDFSEWEEQTASFEFELDEERLPDDASSLQANLFTRDEDLLKARGYIPHVGIDLTRLVHQIAPPQDYPQTGRYFRVQTDVSFRIGHEVSDDQLDWLSAQLTVFLLDRATPPLARAVDLFPRYELTEIEVVTPEPVRWVIAPQLELDPSKLKGSIGSLAGQWERSRTPHCTGQLGDGTRPVWQFKRNATLPLSGGMARTWFLLHLPDGVPSVRARMGLTGSLRAPLLPSLPFIPIRVPYTHNHSSIPIPERSS